MPPRNFWYTTPKFFYITLPKNTRDSEKILLKILNIGKEVKLSLNTVTYPIIYPGSNYFVCGFAQIASYDITKNGTFQKISTMCHSNNDCENKQ